MIINFEQIDADDPYFKIKYEICDILNYYLDYKMDFYLNNLKIKFKDFVKHSTFFEMLEKQELDIDD